MSEKFVIKYSDGLYEHESGFPVTLEGATRYETAEAACAQAANLCWDPVVIPEPPPTANLSDMRRALAAIARDIAEEPTVTTGEVDAAYALARECAREEGFEIP
jgi:hypothetical protein